MAEKEKSFSSETGDQLRWDPTQIHADHGRNASRCCLYDTPDELMGLLGENRCCFRLEEIEHRLYNPVDGILEVGQTNAISVYKTPTGHGWVVDGYLRHAAFLLAHARGQLDQIPSGPKILCTVVPEPDGSNDGWHRIARHNFAENSGRKGLTHVDLARYGRYLTTPEPFGIGLDPKEAAAEMGITLSVYDKLMRLLRLHPQTILDVHEGRVKLTRALDEGSRRGEGGAVGPRPGVKHTQIRSAVASCDWRPPPSHGLDSEGLLLLVRAIAPPRGGSAPELPDQVREWVEFLTLDPAEAKALRPSAKVVALEETQEEGGAPKRKRRRRRRSKAAISEEAKKPVAGADRPKKKRREAVVVALDENNNAANS